jgi:hypothetical protein
VIFIVHKIALSLIFWQKKSINKQLGRYFEGATFNQERLSYYTHSIADSSLFPTSMYLFGIFSPKKKIVFLK